MVKKIDAKITGYQVKTAEMDEPRIATPEESAEQLKKAEVVRMHESVQRPDMLVGSTYKVKTPVTEHAMYITCLLYTSPSPRDKRQSRMPSSA